MDVGDREVLDWAYFGLLFKKKEDQRGRPLDWDPFVDSGLAFELAVHLGITIYGVRELEDWVGGYVSYCDIYKGSHALHVEVGEGDVLRAVRRAIVIAASHIGRELYYG